MKLKKRVILIAIAVITIASVFGSCSKKTCPAYSSVQTTQNQNNG